MKTILTLNETADMLSVLPVTVSKFVVEQRLKPMSTDPLLFDKDTVLDFRDERRKQRRDAFSELREIDTELFAEEN